MAIDIDVVMQPQQLQLLRLVDYELYRERHPNPLPRPDHDATIIGDGGSRGSAKSYAGRAVMLLRRLKYPGTAGLIFRRKWKQVRENHLENGYFKQYPFMRSWWQEAKRTLQVPTNPPSRIVFGIAEHPGDIDDYQGHEYMDMVIDEAARMTETELVKLNVARRWTGKIGGKPMPDWMCKTIWLMNPGGPGHNYIRRLMYKKEYHDKESAESYAFLQAYAWDNIEWARAALAEANLSDKQYYAWTDKERFRFFIERTQYGRELNALPHRLRVGWLLGNWDEFAGQFFDIWDPARFVKPCKPSRDWHPLWLGIDWGFQHPLSCHWFNREGKKTKIYREHVNNQHSARAQAQEIVDLTPKDERERIDAIYLSPDAFQERSEQDSFADLMGEVFLHYKMPFPTRADDDRQHGSQAMYDAMVSDELEIDPSCVHLIETIPMVCTAEDDPKDIEKFEGDDSFDSARYGIKSRLRAGTQPITERIHDRMEEFASAKNKSVEELEPTSRAMMERRLSFQEHRRIARRRGGLGPIFHPQPSGGA